MRRGKLKHYKQNNNKYNYTVISLGNLYLTVLGNNNTIEKRDCNQYSEFIESLQRRRISTTFKIELEQIDTGENVTLDIPKGTFSLQLTNSSILLCTLRTNLLLTKHDF